MLSGAEVGFFEDYEDDEVLVVGVAGVDGNGAWRSFLIQRSTSEPDEQEVQSEMDSYCVSTELGFTAYGCLWCVRLEESLLTLDFRSEDAKDLEISASVKVDLSDSGIDRVSLSRKLIAVLNWGVPEKRPQLLGLSL